MSKFKKSEVNLVAREAIDLILTARQKQAEKERRQRIRLNRGQDASWAEARRASMFGDKVIERIKKSQFDFDGMTEDECFALGRFIDEQAADHAFEWMTRKVQDEAAEEHDQQTLKNWQRVIFNTLAYEGIDVGEYSDGVTNAYHGCDDTECMNIVLDEVKQIEKAKSLRAKVEAKEIEFNKREAERLEAEARAEKLVSEATGGKMNLDGFREYVNTGQYKRDVEEVLEAFGFSDLAEGEHFMTKASVDHGRDEANALGYGEGVKLTTEGGEPEAAVVTLITKNGDTMSNIAKQFDMSVDDLIDMNQQLKVVRVFTRQVAADAYLIAGHEVRVPEERVEAWKKNLAKTTVTTPFTEDAKQDESEGGDPIYIGATYYRIVPGVDVEGYLEELGKPDAEIVSKDDALWVWRPVTEDEAKEFTDYPHEGGEYVSKTVSEEGDTIASIADHYGVDRDELLELNPEFVSAYMFLNIDWDQPLPAGIVLDLPRNTKRPEEASEPLAKTTVTTPFTELGPYYVDVTPSIMDEVALAELVQRKLNNRR